jgi:hypothetical protein
MTVGIVSTVANGWLDGTFATATCFVKLHTADPGAAGATAAAAGSTARVQATMAARRRHCRISVCGLRLPPVP